VKRNAATGALPRQTKSTEDEAFTSDATAGSRAPKFSVEVFVSNLQLLFESTVAVTASVPVSPNAAGTAAARHARITIAAARNDAGPFQEKRRGWAADRPPILELIFAETFN
jgi:hypothetical protein